MTYSLYGDSLYVVVPAPPAAGGAGAAQAATPDAPAGAAAAGADRDYVAQRRFVRTGEVRGDRIAVLEGVKAGEQVVTQGQIKLMPDARVHVDPAAGLPPRATLPKE